MALRGAGLLRAAGSTTVRDRAGDEPGVGIDRIREDWRREHEEEHELSTFAALLAALRGACAEEERTWLPYLYGGVLEELDLAPGSEAAVARFLRCLEDHLIATGRLPAVLFGWVGRRPA